MTKFADLHIHTHFSDSTDSPQEIVKQARHSGLNCIAITDHDTVDGIEPTVQAAQTNGLEIIPAIELSSEMHNKDIHILGYFVDYQNTQFILKLQEFQQARLERLKKMIQKLHEMGINNITVEEVCRLTQSNAVGRPHLATVLVEKGWVHDKKEAFAKYLGEGCPAYIPKFKQTPYEAIAMIRQHKGVAVLAHPMLTNKDELIPSFVEAGLGGIEVYYPNCTQNIVHYFEGIAKKHNLAMTGGSDAHGSAKSSTYVGKCKIPYSLVEQLKMRVGR